MKNNDLINIVEIVKKEYMEKKFEDLLMIINESHVFSRIYNTKEYFFEIDAKLLSDKKINICILGEKKRFFSKGFAMYFTKDIDGNIHEGNDYAF